MIRKSSVAFAVLALALSAVLVAQNLSRLKLINNGTATGTLQQWGGGTGIFMVSGTFNGATIKLQFLGPDSTTLIDAGTGTTFTGPNGGIFTLPPGLIQATVIGGPPSAIYATAQPMSY
jgi:hypothetical protein